MLRRVRSIREPVDDVPVPGSLGEDDIRELKRERMKRDFFYFMQVMWDQIVHEPPVWNWHIPYLCHELKKIKDRVIKGEPKESDLIINIAPGTTKSLTCTIFFPVWCWLEAPWMRIITGSYSGDLSWDHGDLSRDLVKSDRFKEFFPEVKIRKKKDSKSNFQIEYWDETKKKWVNGGSRFSTSVGGTVTGKHAHIIIIDDPLDPNRAVSKAEVTNANHWIDQTLPTRKISKRNTPTILIMQRLAQDDPSGHLLSNKKLRTKHICLPGEIRRYGKHLKPESLRKFYRDDLFDADRMDWEALNELEARLGQYGYAGQIGQSPVPFGGAMFDTDQMITITELPRGKIEWVRFWDKGGTAGGGDYTSGVKMGKYQNPRTKKFLYIIADVRRGQWASHTREEVIRRTTELDGPNVKVFVEQEPGSGGKESAENTIDNLAGYRVWADRPSGRKEFRADPLSVQVNRGNVVLLTGVWNADFIDEFKFFPNSKYDDQVDSASGAFSKLTRFRKAGTWGTKKEKPMLNRRRRR